jgi:cytochrome c oxidase subunit 3
VSGVLLWLAAFLGVAFLALKGVEYRTEYFEHLVPGINFAVPGPNPTAVYLFFSFYFVATGLHALHVAIGIVALAVIGRQAWRGQYSERYHAPITVTGLYWHFVDVVWIFLFALIYLPGRGS